VYVKERLGETNPFAFGDSAAKATKLKDLLDKIESVINAEKFVTLVLDDPIGNSYLQNTYAPDPDPHLKVEKYERTDEQNIEYGITDMRTEDYGENEQAESNNNS
jgi:zinc finger protein